MDRLTRIFVSAHRIGRAVQSGEPEAPITVEHPGGALAYAKRVDIRGPSTVRYSPDAPNALGARVWVETSSKIAIEEEEPND